MKRPTETRIRGAAAGSGAPSAPEREGGNLHLEQALQASEARSGELLAALALSEAQRNAVLEVSLDAVVVMDCHGAVAEWNAAAERIFGRSRAEVLGQPLADLIIPERLREGHRKGLAHYIETGEGAVLGRRIEMHALRADGSEFPVELAITRSPHTDPPSFIGFVRDITARKQAREALRYERTLLRQVLDATPNMIFVKDREGRFLLGNNALARACGTTVDELIGKTDADFNRPEEQLAQFREDDLAVMSTRQPKAIPEEPVTQSDGRVRWFRTAKLPLLNDDGTCDKVLGVAADITEQLLATQALRESEADFRGFFENVGTGTAQVDAAGRFVRVNDRYCEITGYSREELVGKMGPVDLDHPEEREADGERIARFLEGLDPVYEAEKRYVRKDGQVVWVHVTAKFVIDDDGRRRCAAGVIEDITERKRAERRERHRMHVLELLTGGASLEELLQSTVQFVEEENPAAICSVLLLDESGKRLIHGVAPGLPEFYNEAVDGIEIGPSVGSCGTAAFTGQRVIVEDIQTHPYWATFREITEKAGLRACWSQPIFCSEKKVLGTFAIYYRTPRTPGPRDIEAIEEAAGYVSLAIERKRAEEKLLRVNASLEQRVRARTGELQAANRELESFSYSVSHDLRAPLRAVDGFSRMILDRYGGQLDDNGRRMLGVLRNESQRMSRLIDDLLAFSRIGRQKLEPVEIDMTAMARGVFEELVRNEPERRITFNLAPLPPAHGTPSMFRQVWVNLLSNAIKFTREREVAVIDVDAEPGEEAIAYRVRDNGVGFDMRHSEKLFGVFERLHSAQQFEGTGVGLALVQRIIQRHGGKIWAESEPDKGATFLFTLPNA